MLAHVLKVLRQARGLTQEQLARKAKITQAYLAMLESGVKQNPSLEVLQRISQALGLSVGELFVLLEKGGEER